VPGSTFLYGFYCSTTIPLAIPLVSFVQGHKRIEVLCSRRCLQGSGIRIFEDLTTINIQLMKCLHKDSKVKSSWHSKVYAILKNSENTHVDGSIFILDANHCGASLAILQYFCSTYVLISVYLARCWPTNAWPSLVDGTWRTNAWHCAIGWCLVH